MNSIASQIGIDVSGDKLDVSVQGAKAFCVPNTEEGVRSLLRRLPEGAVVHLEASGGYERRCARALRAEGRSVRVHDPLKAKRLKEARGKRAKTDAVDAVELATSGHLLPFSQGKSKEREDLADLSRAISCLQETAKEYKRRLRRPETDEDARGALLQVVDYLERQIDALERRFAERARASSKAREYELVQTVPGVGEKTARTLVSELPEDLGERTPEEIASFAGLAPIDRSSGKSSGRAYVGRGNRRLKAGLYMPAICAARSQGWAKELYARLRDKGKAHQQAIVAVMRRLLLRIVAVLKRGAPWQDAPPTKDPEAKNA